MSCEVGGNGDGDADATAAAKATKRGKQAERRFAVFRNMRWNVAFRIVEIVTQNICVVKRRAPYPAQMVRVSHEAHNKPSVILRQNYYFA